jgi:hypothetical protein
VSLGLFYFYISRSSFPLLGLGGAHTPKWKQAHPPISHYLVEYYSITNRPNILLATYSRVTTLLEVAATFLSIFLLDKSKYRSLKALKIKKALTKGDKNVRHATRRTLNGLVSTDPSCGNMLVIAALYAHNAAISEIKKYCARIVNSRSKIAFLIIMLFHSPYSIIQLKRSYCFGTSH